MKMTGASHLERERCKQKLVIASQQDAMLCTIHVRLLELIRIVYRGVIAIVCRDCLRSKYLNLCPEHSLEVEQMS
jgi:hypothetical protein